MSIEGLGLSCKITFPRQACYFSVQVFLAFSMSLLTLQTAGINLCLIQRTLWSWQLNNCCTGHLSFREELRRTLAFALKSKNEAQISSNLECHLNCPIYFRLIKRRCYHKNKTPCLLWQLLIGRIWKTAI